MNRFPSIMMIFAALSVLVVFGSMFVYAGIKVFRFLRIVIPLTDRANGINHVYIFIGICIFFILSIAAGFIPFDKSIQKHFVWFAWFIIGTSLYLVITFFVSDILLLIGKLLKLIPSPVPQNISIIITSVVFTVTAVLSGVSVYNAKQLSHTSYNVTINRFEYADKLIVVLVSDIHLGYLNDDKWLDKVTHEINAQNPDIVFMAGDIFNDNFKALANPGKVSESLSGINAKFGVYAVPGNHDSGDTYPDMIEFLTKNNVIVLQDEYIVIDNKFVVLGRTDPSPISDGPEPRRPADEVLEEIDAAYAHLPVFVIDHQPGAISEYGNNVDLILAGHTHAGIFFPATNITDLIYGHHNYGYSQADADSPHVIVTSGAGLWGPPFRLGSINEIVRITIE